MTGKRKALEFAALWAAGIIAAEATWLAVGWWFLVLLPVCAGAFAVLAKRHYGGAR